MKLKDDYESPALCTKDRFITDPIIFNLHWKVVEERFRTENCH